MNALELNADLWMRIFSHIPKGQLLKNVTPVCKAWREWVLSMTSRVLQAQIELPRVVLNHGRYFKSEEEDARINLMTLERRILAESLGQYILKRQATLQIVVIRSRNLCIELIRIVWSAIIQCKQLVKLELSMPYVEVKGDHGNEFTASLDQDCFLDLPPSLRAALLSIPFQPKSKDRGDGSRIMDISAASLEGFSPRHLQSLVLTTGFLFLRQLQAFTKLQCLSINNHFHYVVSSSFDPTAVLSSLSRISGLKCLCLNEWPMIGDSFLAMVNQLQHLEALVVCHAWQMDGDFDKLESHPSLQTIKLMVKRSSCKAFTSALGLRQLQELWIEDLEDTELERDVAQIPSLHPQSKLTSLRCSGRACIVVNFWDLISAPALMELDIDCQGPQFTDHCRTAPPTAVAALQRGTLNARFMLRTDDESSLQGEIAIMESSGMVIVSREEMHWADTDVITHYILLELARSTPGVISVMRDVRHSADLPFSPAQLSSHAQHLEDESYLEHALQQQAWHAEFLYQKIFDSYDLEGPGLLSVL